MRNHSPAVPVQCGVGEYAIEMAIRQIELKKILLPYFAAAMGRAITANAGHDRPPRCDRVRQTPEVAAGAATKI